MVWNFVFMLAIAALAAIEVILWKRVELLLTAVSKLSNGLAEDQKWMLGRFTDFDGENELIEKRITKVEELVAQLPVEKLREVAEQEADFIDGLNNILNYGLDRENVKHE